MLRSKLFSRFSSGLLLIVICMGLVVRTPQPTYAQENQPFKCPKTGGTLITAITADPVSLNGIYANDGASVSVLSFIFNPLTMGGENWGREIKGDLAKSWEVSEDGLTWTFHLEEGVKFHDGQELTADDVVYTFQTIQTSKEDIAPFRPRFLQNGEPIKFEAKDKYTVVATLKAPNASFFTDISVPIVPKHVLEGQDLREGPFNRQPVGTGPFKIVEWKSGESIELAANEDYFRGRPCLDRIIFRIIPDVQTQVAALQTGEIDFLASVPGASVPTFKDDPNYQMKIVETDTLFQIFFNLEREQFKDPKVRQALMIAIDRQAVVDIIRQGYGAVHNSHFDSVVSFYKKDKLGGYDYDPKRAGEMLDELGIKDTDGDGFRDKDGKPWEINFLTFTQGFRTYAEFAQAVQAFWEDIGIKVKLEQRDLSTMVEQIYQERKVDKPFDVLTSGWSQIGPEPNSYANFYMWTDELGPNIPNYRNEEVNKLFIQAQGISDNAERMKLYEQIEKILWDELPTLPIYSNTEPVVINKRFNIDAAQLDLSISTNFAHPERIYEN